MPRQPNPPAGLVAKPSSLLWVASAVTLLSSACRPAEVVTRIPIDEARLKGIVTIYAYAAADRGRPPRSVEDLLPIFRQASIDDPDGALTSSRDGQPFVIVWGLDLAGRHAGTSTPLAYEREGRDGTRLLVTCGQQLRELSEEEFAAIDWPDGHVPTP